MQKSNKTLCLFTAEYPYGNKSEAYIETEIQYLSKSFSKIIIFPSLKNEVVRLLPENAIISDVCINISMEKSRKIKALLTNIYMVIMIFISEIKDKGFYKSLFGYKVLLDYLAKQILIADEINKYLDGNYQSKVFYDYWFCDKVLALSILKYRIKKFDFISRAHRYDVYDECWDKIGVPFRAWKMRYIQTLYLISDHGKKYIEKKISKKYLDKLYLSRLGIDSQFVKNNSLDSKIRTIVSCSNMYKFKSVVQIPEVLKLIDEKVHWIHFGDGNERQNVEKACESLPLNITYELKGHVDNQDVIKYYQNNNVSLFISLSKSEGLPVSMMEALSFNIPIVAVPAGGVPELVSDGVSGFILPEKFDAEKYAEIVKCALEFSFDKNEMEKFFNQNFDANINYSNFCSKISS